MWRKGGFRFFYYGETAGRSANNYCDLRTRLRTSLSLVHRARMERWIKCTVYGSTTNTDSWHCPRLTISRTAVKSGQSLANQRFELGHCHRVRVWRCWWNSSFLMGFQEGERVRCSLYYKRTRSRWTGSFELVTVSSQNILWRNTVYCCCCNGSQ